MKQRLIAALLTAHAVAHLVGFAWPWWLVEPGPYATPVPDGAIFIGDTAMQALSLVWLATATAFLIAAVAVARGHPAWRGITSIAAIFSLVLSVLCWPGSLLGVPINVAILTMLWATNRPRWPLAHA